MPTIIQWNFYVCVNWITISNINALIMAAIKQLDSILYNATVIQKSNLSLCNQWVALHHPTNNRLVECSYMLFSKQAHYYSDNNIMTKLIGGSVCAWLAKILFACHTASSTIMKYWLLSSYTKLITLQICNTG